MEVKFSRYDTADYLKTEDDIAAYLDAVMEDGDPALIAAARAMNRSQRSCFTGSGTWSGRALARAPATFS